jgi:hypothetical protein
MGTRQGRAFRNLELVAEDPAAVDRELGRLRAEAGEQDVEIARLRDEAAEVQALQRRESDLTALVGRLGES